MSTIESGDWKLVDKKTGAPVRYSEVRPDFRGDRRMVVGGTPPHKPSSTGRISVVDPLSESEYPDSQEFFPTVVGCAWVWTGDTDPWASALVSA